MKIIPNPYIKDGLSHPALTDIPFPSGEAAPAVAMLSRCPERNTTPLAVPDALAQEAGIGKLFVKDERTRMGVGSFKAFGAAYVIACDAAQGKAKGRSYVTASAGNHGISVAAGAKAFGAKAEIFIADTVPESFAETLRSFGAEVMREGVDYEASMAAALARAEDDPKTRFLLSDSSWAGYTDRPWLLMQGYLALMDEVSSQITDPPSHVFLQAGVGGFAGAMAAYIRAHWSADIQIIIVEPEAAPALIGSIEAGAPVAGSGPVSAMGRLDCKEPSLIALKGLARDADFFMTLSEEEAQRGTKAAAAQGLQSSPSGAAGIAGLLALDAPSREALDLSAHSTVLAFLTEGEA